MRRSVGSVSAVWALPALPAIVAALVVAGVACAVTWPSLIGDMPISQDHTVHLFRVWHFFEKRLLHGQLTAWSSDWFAGWPAGEDYPPGGDMWMAAFRALTPFGSWDATYAVGFAAMYAAVGLALFAFARSWNLAAAVIAALLLLLDRGEYREGGFLYTVYWGVWPQHLSLGFVVGGFTALFRHLERPVDDARWLAAAAAAFGAALVCHPITLILLVAALPAFVVAHWQVPVRAASRIAIAIGLGWAIAAFFSLPFSARAAWMATYGDPWKSLGGIGAGLIRGDVFRNVPPPVIWTALIGCGLGMWLRDKRAIFLATWAALLLLIASSTITDAAWLVRVSSAFGQVQWQRLVAPCKAAVFLLAAFAICRALPVLLTPWLRTWKRTWRLTAAFGLLIALVAATPFSYRAWRKDYSPDRVRDQRAFQAHYNDFLAWSSKTRRETTDFYRIAYVAPYNDHAFAAAPVWNHTPAYKVGYTPAANFVHKPDQGTPALYKTLSVKYVVTKRRLTEPLLELERSFGPIHVYRFSDYTPQRWTLAGPGTATAEVFDEEHIRLNLRGTTAQSRVILHVAEHPRWTARLSGRVVPIGIGTLAEEPIFISVAGGGGGTDGGGLTLDVRLERKPIDIAAAAISILAVLLVLGLAFWGRQSARQKIVAPLVRWDRFVATGVGWALAIGVALAGVRAARAAQPAKWSLRDNLAAAVVSIERSGADGEGASVPTPCPWDGGRHRCAGPSWSYVGPAEQRMAGALHSCLWAHPINNGRLRIHVPAVPLAKTLIVRHGLADSAIDGNRAGAPVRLTIALDGTVVRDEVRPNRKGFPAVTIATAGRAKADLDLSVTASRDSGRHYCIDVETRE